MFVDEGDVCSNFKSVVIDFYNPNTNNQEVVTEDEGNRKFAREQSAFFCKNVDETKVVNAYKAYFAPIVTKDEVKKCLE